MPTACSVLHAFVQCTRFSLLLVTVTAVLGAGCAAHSDSIIAPEPDRSWPVPQTARYAAVAGGRSEPAPAAGNPAHAAPAVEPEKIYELAELIDIAQRTNPETRIAWERAREAALAIGVAEAVHAPILSAKASAAYQRVPLPLPKTILNPQGFFVADTQIFLPALT